MRNFFKFGVFVLIAIVLSGLAGWWLSADLTFVVPGADQSIASLFWQRFQVLFLLSALIERSVEVYLKATNQNGSEQFDPSTNTITKINDASRPAMIAALVVSLLVATSGVRIIQTFVTVSDLGFFKSVLWHGVDILVSAGLMAGGSDLFHKLAGVIVGGLDSAKHWAKGESKGGMPVTIDPATHAALAAAAPAARAYAITVKRPKGALVDEGTLEFKDGGVSITSKCWWDPNNRIDAGTYTKCSKTVFASKKIDAIYLPDAVSKVTGEKQIFIHHGTSSANSLGCIAVDTENFKTLYSHIKPSNAQNVAVTIEDV